MWIIPTNLPACPSAPATAESNLDLNELAFLCGQSFMWRGKHSPQRTWSQRLKRNKWLRRLSGRMLKPSHIQTFTAAWTSCLPAIPANRSARQDKEKAKPTSDTYGHSLQEELPLVSPDLCSPKTSKDTCPLGLRTSSTTWAEWVTSTRQDYLARRKSAQATEGNGCSGSRWTTPAARDWKDSSGMATTRSDGRNRLDQLPRQVFANTNGRNPERWPTPTATQAEKPQGPNSNQKGLESQAKWATPEAQNQTGYQTKNGQVFPRLGSQANGKLNPNWVEQLMGLDVGRTQLPTEWTDCDCWATESSRKQQQRHG